MFGYWKSKIPVKKSNQGSHGDHWSAIFGFEDHNYLAQSIQNLVETLTVHEHINRNISRLRSDFGVLAVLGIGNESDLKTLYPALQVTEEIPVTIKEILEWSHVNSLEAQVRGAGRDTFGLDFFALDYLENKSRYTSGGVQPIGLGGLAYVLDKAEDMPENFSVDFCAYMPNTEMPCGHDFNFIGNVLSVEDRQILSEMFKLLRVKMVNVEEQPDMFNLPLLVNHKNIQCPEVVVGQKVSGCFWLHGRIAE